MEPNSLINLTSDTICAISTPPGVGGIAVARVSGPCAIEIVDSRWKGHRLAEAVSHSAHLGTVVDADGRPLDQAVATVYRAPRSFTGDDVVEIAVHGSRFVQRELLSILTEAGARLAQAGEFTRRAYVSGKLDLAEAEAVADVIASNSRAAHRIALNQMRGGFSKRLSDLRAQLVDLTALLELELDFSEEEVEFASREKLRHIASQIETEITRLHRSFATGAAIKDGIPVAIVGATNAGKSSLLNAILGEQRAIVSDIHGTTRDTIEDAIEIGDYLFRFIDTAGLRETSDTIERLGIERSRQALEHCRIAILVVDSSDIPNADFVNEILGSTIRRADNPGHLLIVANKADINPSSDVVSQLALQSSIPIISLSAKTRQGLDALFDQLKAAIEADDTLADEDILVTNVRHAEALAAASKSIARVIQALDAQLPGDLVAQDLRETIANLAAITGDIPSTEILTTIFSRFCVGK